MTHQVNLPTIIGIVGPIRSGKSSAAEYLSHNYGYTYTPNVRVLKSILTALGLPPERNRLIAVGDALFSDLGKDIIAKARVSEVLRNIQSEEIKIVVDGIRYIEELHEYRTLNSFRLLAISSHDGIRYERTLRNSDKTKDGYISEQQFLALKNIQSEENVPYLMNHSDFIIENNSSRNDFETAIDLAIKEFNIT